MCPPAVALIAPQLRQTTADRNSYDLAYCWRATASARSKCACVFVVSGLDDMSTRSPAIR